MATKAPTNETTTEAVETIEPVAVEKTVVLGEGENAITFVQKPLSFFGKIEFLSIAGKAVEKVLSDGGSLSEILDVPDYDSGAVLSGPSDADVFVKAISKVIQSAPELLVDLYCVILAVPRAQRGYVSLRLEDDLTDAQGVEILETFVDQNWEIMTNFFKEKAMPLFQKVATKVQS